MAITETEAPAKTGPSLIVMIAVLAGLTAVALGIGWLVGQSLGSRAGFANTKPEAEAPAGETGHEESGTALVNPNLLPLDPILTSLAGSGNTWVRMEAALLFDGPPDAALAEQIHQDILAYLRTVKLQQVEGASGLKHLKSDLDERAQIASDGRVKTVLIRTLLFE